MGRVRSEGSGRLILGLLLGSLLLAAILGVNAHFAVAYHRRTAEGVLRDYAALAAGEFVRRAASEVGYRGYYPLVSALERGDLGDAKALAETGEDRLRRAAVLVRRLVRLPEAPGDAAALPDWIPVALAATPEGEEDPYFPVTGPGAAGEERYVFTRPDEAGNRLGFQVETGALPVFFERVLDRPLLPPSLGDGSATNDALTLTVHDGGGESFRSGADHHPGLEVAVPFGDEYSGALRGLDVRVSIDPAAASRLVVGGLPRSRLPVVAGLVALAAVLIVVAGVQLRRERHLARLRSDFVASVSHELRTPLTQIRMFAETLRLGRVRSEAEGRRALEVIDREARRLSQLVENLLRFSRSEHPPAADLEEAPLAPLVDETVEAFAPLAAEAGVEVATQLTPARARVDADALRGALLNLLENAAKYAAGGRRVEVALEPLGPTGARLVVADRGPGVPAAERRRVFDRFHRLARDRTAVQTGAGVGLAVVQDVAAAHGGSSRVEDNPGGGARFVIELPP